MGCFLGCFDCPTKRKLRKPHNKAPSGYQKHGRYVPLDSKANFKLDIRKNLTTSDSKQRDTVKETLSNRVKKKVTFNLSVKFYEPIPNDDIKAYFSESDDRTKLGENEEDAQKSTPMQYEEDAVASRIETSSTVYRYQNCRDSYDEEDYIKLGESNLDEDEDEYDDNKNDKSCEEITQVEFLKQLNPSSMELEENVVYTLSTEEQARHHQEIKKVESNVNARYRSRYVYSVLNPVENLSHWKVVKARPSPLKPPMKENTGAGQQHKIPLRFNHSKLLIHEKAITNRIVSYGTEPITRNNCGYSHITVEKPGLFRYGHLA